MAVLSVIKAHLHNMCKAMGKYLFVTSWELAPGGTNHCTEKWLLIYAPFEGQQTEVKTLASSKSEMNISGDISWWIIYIVYA